MAIYRLGRSTRVLAFPLPRGGLLQRVSAYFILFPNNKAAVSIQVSLAPLGRFDGTSLSDVGNLYDVPSFFEAVTFAAIVCVAQAAKRNCDSNVTIPFPALDLYNLDRLSGSDSARSWRRTILDNLARFVVSLCFFPRVRILNHA